MKDNTNKGYLSAQGYFGLSRYTNNFNNQQTSNQSLGNNPVNSQDTSKVMAQGRVQNEGFDFAHFLVQEKKKMEPKFLSKNKKSDFKGLHPSNGGGGKSLKTFSICFELSWPTILATRPSRISPCTFMWSFDPEANW